MAPYFIYRDLLKGLPNRGPGPLTQQLGTDCHCDVTSLHFTHLPLRLPFCDRPEHPLKHLRVKRVLGVSRETVDTTVSGQLKTIWGLQRLD